MMTFEVKAVARELSIASRVASQRRSTIFRRYLLGTVYVDARTLAMRTFINRI